MLTKPRLTGQHASFMGEPLRILFLATAWRGHGGVNTINRGLSTAVAALQDDLRCTVWCGLPSEPSEDERAEMESVGVRPLIAESSAVEEANHRLSSLDLTNYSFDVIVGHGRWSGEAAYELRTRYGVRTVAYFVHVDPEVEYGKKRDTPADQRFSEIRASDGQLHKQADIAFGVGRKLCSAFPGRTVPLLPPFTPKRYLQPAKTQALLIGRLEDPLKGAEIAMTAMAFLNRSFPDLELELRGAKRDFSELESMAGELLQRHFDLDSDLAVRAPGFVTDHVQIADSFEHARVVLMPSLFEGFGLVALEALEHGRPVVVSSRSGLAALLGEVLPPEICEKFVVHIPARRMETGDMKWKEVVLGLRGKVEWFLQNEAEGQQLVCDVQNALRSECDPERNARKFADAVRGAGDMNEPRISSHLSPPQVSIRPTTVPEHATASRDDLRSWPKTISGEWLERAEEEVLLTRMHSGEPLTLLTGGPGLGKSALLRSVTERLDDEGWSVCAIKADLMPPTHEGQRWGMEELDRYLGHERDTLSVLLHKVAAGERVALLVDQLDAVAAIVDTQTGRLSVLLKLIQQCALSGEIPVLAAARTFDVLYDSRLRRLSERRLASTGPLEVVLRPLERDAVATVWTGATKRPLPERHDHLLVPHTLKLAVSLLKPYTSEAEVVSEFWRKATDGISVDAHTELHTFTSRLEQEESLWIDFDGNAHVWKDREVLVPAPDGIRWGFSHQRLREHALAAQWFADNDAATSTLVDWVGVRAESLNMRPRLRAILSHLRREPPTYLDAFDDLSEEFADRLHIRELLASNLGQAAGAPSLDEVKRMKRLLQDEVPGIRMAAASSIHRHVEWFEALRDWLPTQMTTERSEWIAPLLRSSWSVDAKTIEKLIRDHWLHSSREGDALWVLSERKHWSAAGRRLAMEFARHDVDNTNHRFGWLLQATEKTDSALSVRLRAAYAASVLKQRRANLTEKSVDSDLFSIEPEYGWLKAAALEPELYVTGMTDELVKTMDAEVKTLMSHYAEGELIRSHQTWYDWERRFPRDSPLEGMESAITSILPSDLRLFEDVVTKLAHSRNELAHVLLLRVHRSLKSKHPELVANLFLRSPQTLGINPGSSQLLTGLAEVVSPEKAELLRRVIRDYNRDPRTVGDPERRARRAKSNESFRTGLLALFEGDLNLTEARAVAGEWRTRSGTGRSEYSTAELAGMSDDERLTVVKKFDDQHMGGHFEWAGEDLLSPGAFLHALREWGKNSGGSLGLAESLRGLEDSEAPQYLAVVGALLRYPPKSLSASECEKRLCGILQNGYGLTSVAKRERPGSVVRNFWSDVIDVATQLAASSSGNWSAALVDVGKCVMEWLKSHQAESRELGIQKDDTSLPEGAPYPSVVGQALELLRMDGAPWSSPVEEKKLYRAIQSNLSTYDWQVHLLRDEPSPESKSLWVPWLNNLLATQDNPFLGPLGAALLLRSSTIADSEQVSAWIDSIDASDWPSRQRTSAELRTRLAFMPKHHDAFSPWLDERLSFGTLAVPESVQIGVAHGLAYAWTSTSSRGAAQSCVKRFFAGADESAVRILATRLPVVETKRFFELADALRESGRTWPDTVAYRVAEAVANLVEDEPAQALRLAQHLLDAPQFYQDETLVVVAYRLQREASPELRRGGMELFERLLQMGFRSTHQLLETLG